MTDFSINGKTMSAEQIFNILDAEDGQDEVIKKNTWNIFAAKANGNTITNFIKRENAIAAIGRYLSNADDKVMSDVFEHVLNISSKNEKTSANVESKPSETVQDINQLQNPQPAQEVETQTKTVSEHKHYQPKMTSEEVKSKYPEVYAMVEKNIKKYKNNNADPAYWTELIATASEKYGVAPEAIVSIIGREVRWVENPRLNKQSGGPMQVTRSTIEDFWPGTWRNENYWAKLDGDLLNEILYDENGKMRYNTPKDLWKACIADHEYGIKVGILIYKSKELKALARIKNCNQRDIISDIESVKSGMNEKQLNVLQRRTFANYNGGGTEGYAADTYASYLQCKEISKA